MKEKPRRKFLKTFIAALSGVVLISNKKEKEYHIPGKPLREADFYKKHNLLG